MYLIFNFEYIISIAFQSIRSSTMLFIKLFVVFCCIVLASSCSAQNEPKVFSWSVCPTSFSRKMINFIKLVLIAMLLCCEFPQSFITIGMETYKSISSLYSYYQYKAEKTQIQQCQKVMDSALDEIDFLRDFEVRKIENTTRIDVYHEHDEDEQVPWFVKVLKDKKIRFSFLGLNWSTNETFEAESPMLLKIVAKDKIKAYEELEKKAIQMHDKSFNQVFDHVINVMVCLVILYMMTYEVERVWMSLPMFQLWLILELQGWIRISFLRETRETIHDLEEAYGRFWLNWLFWIEWKWGCFTFLMFCPIIRC